MTGNFDVELQTSRHIARNPSDGSQLTILLCFIGVITGTFLVYFTTSLGFLPSSFVAILAVCAVATPIFVSRQKRKFFEDAELHKNRSEQLDSMRNKKGP